MTIDDDTDRAPSSGVAAPVAEPSPSWRDLVALIREDLQVHRGDRHAPGFHALAVHRFGAWVHRLPAGPQRWLLRRVHRACARRIRTRYAIELPPTATIGRRLRIPHSGPVVLHPYSRIGDDCMLRQSTALGTNGPWRADSAPTLGDGVQLGVGASVLGRVVVGDEATVGPGAVVFFDVPAGATVVVHKPRIILREDKTVASAAHPEDTT